MSCLQHHLTNSATQLTVTNLNYTTHPLQARRLVFAWVGSFSLKTDL